MINRYPALVVTGPAGTLLDWKWATRESGQLHHKAALRTAAVRYLSGIYEQQGTWFYPVPDMTPGALNVSLVGALPIDMEKPLPSDRRVIELAASTIGEPIFAITSAIRPVSPNSQGEALYLKALRHHWQTDRWIEPAIRISLDEVCSGGQRPEELSEILAAYGMALSDDDWPESNDRFLDLCGHLHMDRLKVVEGIASLAQRIGIFSGKEYAK